MYRLAIAKTPKECSLLLSAWCFHYEYFFDTIMKNSFYGSKPLSSLKKEEQGTLIPSPVTADDDSGPKDAWYWAHTVFLRQRLYNTREQHGLRMWAYVMWDSARLRDWGVLRGMLDRRGYGPSIDDNAWNRCEGLRE